MTSKHPGLARVLSIDCCDVPRTRIVCCRETHQGILHRDRRTDSGRPHDRGTRRGPRPGAHELRDRPAHRRARTKGQGPGRLWGRGAQGPGGALDDGVRERLLRQQPCLYAEFFSALSGQVRDIPVNDWKIGIAQDSPVSDWKIGRCEENAVADCKIACRRAASLHPELDPLRLPARRPEPRRSSFYEIEATSQSWTVRELKRQYDSSLYERLALSRDKKGIRKLATEGQIVTRPEDLLKEPLVLEFLGLEEHHRYSESDLETAIIDQIERFLLELGKGFLFQARQRRFTFDGDHYFVDLVFYNRLLRGYVLIDLKLGKLTHQDLGQMQMYVNYFDEEEKLPEEAPTIGIVLCKQKNKALVRMTLPKDANIHAREYRLYLPSKEELQRKLVEWTE